LDFGPIGREGNVFAFVEWSRACGQRWIRTNCSNGSVKTRPVWARRTTDCSSQPES